MSPNPARNVERGKQSGEVPRLVALILAYWIATGEGFAAPPVATSQQLDAARNRMVDEEIVAAGVKDPRVIQAMRDTPRHEFTPMAQRPNAYYDMALPIGEGQTISPPFIVAYMTEQLDPKPSDKVLEIGTGSGYQAAVLSPLVKEVYSIEIVKVLGERAARTLKRLKYPNVETRVGDGYQGWPEHAPFDKIIVTCSPDKIPEPLVEQLREGGRMVIPVGERYQQKLFLLKKEHGKMISEALLPTLFVPMTGKAEEARQVKPDPDHPAVINGGFEQLVAGAREPSGWHYVRQMQVLAAKDAPEGKQYVTFSNTQSGRGSQALQGLAVDGRSVSELDVSLWVKAHDIAHGQSDKELPMLAVVFYDSKRVPCGHTWMGPWRGSFDWRKETDHLRVPLHAREAVVRIGLNGATGEISFDDIQIKAAKKK